jgi:UDP-N-acetylglucosamine/UDP-N-acetylgalactosamine diphosphorylase
LIGYHLLSASEMSTLVVAKQDPSEKVGVLAEIDGQVRVLEYSDLPAEAAARRTADGALALWAGNTAVHVFDLSFLERAAAHADTLPFHLAFKAVPFIDELGELVVPKQPNAIKFERFIFDLLPHAKNAIVVEIDPAEGFAPIKNASGALRDTPETARAAMIALHRRWLRAAGAVVADDAVVEVSPHLALDVEQLQAKIKPGTRIVSGTFLQADR